MSSPLSPLRLHSLSTLLACGALASVAAAQMEPPPSMTVPYELDTGWRLNSAPALRVIHSEQVHNPYANWLRLHFDEVDLGGDELAGSGATLRITSYEDGDVQEFSASGIYQWGNSTAYFNGHTVQVEILAPPGIGGRFHLSEIDVGLPHLDEPTICGTTDDRTFSSDPRVARLLPVGCTGWLINDCDHCMLTAGHCSGGLSVAEFNVPKSNANGSLRHPAAIHQYAIDGSSLQTNGGQGVGNDWSYFGAFANSGSGLTPYASQGMAFQLVNPPGTSGTNIRITGFGTDSGRENQAEQTEVGPMAVSSGTTVGYVTDTTGGNSGSPVIWDQSDQAIGIHTHGGCSSSGGNNWGTGANHAALQNAISSPQGVCACGGPGGPTVLFADGFESGDFSSGGWTLTTQRPRVKVGAAKSGYQGARVRNTSAIERAIDTTGFTSIELFYTRRTKNLDSGETLTVDWFNGSSWTVLESTSVIPWTDRHYNLPAAAAGNPAFRIRFACNANEGKERADIDDVLVIGS